MQPSLSYVSPNGALLDQGWIGIDKKLSIRHLAHDGAETVPLWSAAIVVCFRTSILRCWRCILKVDSLNHWMWSLSNGQDLITISQVLRHQMIWIIATSPRGNCYGIWSKETKELAELSALSDASGAVLLRWWISTQLWGGSVVSQRKPYEKSSQQSSVQWDNHWSAPSS